MTHFIHYLLYDLVHTQQTEGTHHIYMAFTDRQESYLLTDHNCILYYINFLAISICNTINKPDESGPVFSHVVTSFSDSPIEGCCAVRAIAMGNTLRHLF